MIIRDLLEQSPKELLLALLFRVEIGVEVPGHESRREQELKAEILDPQKLGEAALHNDQGSSRDGSYQILLHIASQTRELCNGHRFLFCCLVLKDLLSFLQCFNP